jgi:hypothetical protein
MVSAGDTSRSMHPALHKMCFAGAART